MRRIATLLTWSLPKHECSIVGRDIPPWALSIPTCSCWVYKNYKSLMTLYMSHLLGLFAVNNPEGWVNIFPQRVGLLLLSTRANSLFLSCNAIHYMCSYPSCVLYKSLVGLLGYWEQTQTNMKLWLLLLLWIIKILCLSPNVLMSYARVHKTMAS